MFCLHNMWLGCRGPNNHLNSCNLIFRLPESCYEKREKKDIGSQCLCKLVTGLSLRLLRLFSPLGLRLSLSDKIITVMNHCDVKWWLTGWLIDWEVDAEQTAGTSDVSLSLVLLRHEKKTESNQFIIPLFCQLTLTNMGVFSEEKKSQLC